MMSSKTFGFLRATVVCLLILIGSCAPAGKEITAAKVRVEKAPAPEAVRLALKFAPQDSTSYKATTEEELSFKYEGTLPTNADSSQGRSCKKTELTFTEQIQSIDDKGNAVVKITIEDLKYSSIIKDKTVLDFDKSKNNQPTTPLARLIGQSYTIEIAPTGQVVRIIDVNQAQAAVDGPAAGNETALAMVSQQTIKDRHGTLVLPAADQNQLHTGGNWSNTRSFSFKFMGSKSYERVYTLKEVKDANNHRTAIVDMSAIPTSKMAEQLHKEHTSTDLSGKFDSTGTYTGRLEFDLTAGKVKKYIEKVQLEWVAVDPYPRTGREREEGPAAMRLGAARLYTLEKID